MRCSVRKPQGAVVIGGHINGLGIIRSLAARGIPTAVILTKAYDFAHHSRYISEYESALEMAERPEQLLEALDRRSCRWKEWALFPVNDEALAAIAHSRQQLESMYSVIAPTNEVMPYLLDKKLMLDAAESVGIPTPLCYGPAVQVTADRLDLRFPVIVKPLAGYRFQERFGCKVFVAADRAELRQAISQVERAGIPCQVFDIIPGADSRIYCHCVYIDARGNPRADVTIRKIRQSPPFFGVSRVAEIAPNGAHMREQTNEFLRRIGFRGIAVVEYKLDPRDNTFRFLEINGRSVIYNSLLRKAGMDLAWLAWSDYIENRHETARIRHWPGVWINLHADLLYSTFRGRSEGLRPKDFLSPYMRPMIEAVWSVRDPKPFLVEWSRTFGRSFKGLSGKSPDSRS
jgi:D-aspartate ligase